jgi:hypothetical protein
MVCICNLSYLRGGDKRVEILRPVEANVSEMLSWTQNTTQKSWGHGSRGRMLALPSVCEVLSSNSV